MTFFTNAAPTGAQPAFGLTQNGRAGMQMLGSIQKFSSTKMREAARTCFDESEAGQALIAEHRQGNAERPERKSVAEGKRVAVRVDRGGRSIIQKKKKKESTR